mgnify:CR=1 FL=1
MRSTSDDEHTPKKQMKTQAAPTTFVALALSGPVFKRALKIALIVGTLLALINHGERILTSSLTPENLLQIFLTYLVPYSVSTYSSVRSIQAHAAQQP